MLMLCGPDHSCRSAWDRGSQVERNARANEQCTIFYYLRVVIWIYTKLPNSLFSIINLSQRVALSIYHCNYIRALLMLLFKNIRYYCCLHFALFRFSTILGRGEIETSKFNILKTMHLRRQFYRMKTSQNCLIAIGQRNNEYIFI